MNPSSHPFRKPYLPQRHPPPLTITTFLSKMSTNGGFLRFHLHSAALRKWLYEGATKTRGWRNRYLWELWVNYWRLDIPHTWKKCLQRFCCNSHSIRQKYKAIPSEISVWKAFWDNVGSPYVQSPIWESHYNEKCLLTSQLVQKKFSSKYNLKCLDVHPIHT